VFWNGSIGAVSDERHGLRDLNWHEWAHKTIGTRYDSGFALTLPTEANSDELEVAGGTIHDEDKEHNINTETTCRLWRQTAAGVFTFENGTDNAGRDFPFFQATGTPQFCDSADYTLKDVSNNDYVCYFVYASPDVDRPIYLYTPPIAAAYNTIALARLSPTAPSFSPEIKLLYRLIFNGNGDLEEITDFRTATTVPGGGSTATTAAAVSFTPTGDLESTTVQAAIEELETDRDADLLLKMSIADYLKSAGNLAAPILHLPLDGDIHLERGVGTAEFTRATTATYIDRSGVLQTAAIDEPRFEKKGLLMEGGSTNLISYSEVFSGLWTNVNLTITDTIADPAGGTLAHKLENTAGGVGYINYNVGGTGIVAGEKVTASAFIKYGNAPLVDLRLYGATEEAPMVARISFDADGVGTLSGGAYVAYPELIKLEALADGWYRLSITGTMDVDVATRPLFRIYSSANNTAGEYCYTYGCQLERKPFSTSYMPTSGAAATRTFEAMIVDGPGNLPGPADAMTILADVEFMDLLPIAANSFYKIMGEVYRLAWLNPTGQVHVYNGLTPDAITAPIAEGRYGFRFSGLDLEAFLDGAGTGSPQTTNLDVTGAATNLAIGATDSAGNNPLYGHIKNFRIYGQSLTDEEMGIA
jgi:hypothetical protein